MVRKGPGAKPTALKHLHGTYRADRAPAHEAAVDPASPECPEELSDEAEREWQRVSEELLAAGLLTRIDRAALAGYCQAWGTWIDAQASLRQYGVIIKSPNGYPMISPYVTVANKAFEQMRMMLQEFGMSPSSRTRVEAVPPHIADDLFTKYDRR